ncbi:MAG: hypothetical protein EOP11_05330 [Proteobacteria bacterium]|nr:MAG: hypothetical protein EOP11_05330 [Pseudomonadota bacterium]
MKALRLLLAALVLIAGVSAVDAQAQSYGMPGNDYVRQHPNGDRALWQYCQTHYRTDSRCYAVTRPGRGRN